MTAEARLPAIAAPKTTVQRTGQPIRGPDMIQRWSSACLLLLMPLAIRSMPGGGDAAGVLPPTKAAQHAARDGAGSAAARTAEPLPPLGVSVETTALQKNPKGAIASLRLKVNASVAIEDAELTARAPGRVVFAAGSASRTWKVDLATGGSATVPVEVIVPE